MSDITPEQVASVLTAIKGLCNIRLTNTQYPAAGQSFEFDKTPHILVPDNCRLTNMESAMPQPRRICALPQLHDLPSFTSYVNRFKTPETTIFGARNGTGLAVTAIFDYPAPGVPAWGSHRVTLHTVFSEEWKRWQEHDDEEMSQTEFVEFIENETKVFVKPSAADMLTVAKDINLRRTVTWKGLANTETGDIAASFISETKTGGASDVELPSVFTVALQPFLNGDRYQVTARLRPDITDGTLTIHYELQKVEEIIEHAIEEVMESIVGKTGITPFIGLTPDRV